MKHNLSCFWHLGWHSDAAWPLRLQLGWHVPGGAILPLSLATAAWAPLKATSCTPACRRETFGAHESQDFNPLVDVKAVERWVNKIDIVLLSPVNGIAIFLALAVVIVHKAHGSCGPHAFALSVEAGHDLHVFIRELPQLLEVLVLRKVHVQCHKNSDICREEFGERHSLSVTCRPLTSSLLEQPQVVVPVAQRVVVMMDVRCGLLIGDQW